MDESDTFSYSSRNSEGGRGSMVITSFIHAETFTGMISLLLELYVLTGYAGFSNDANGLHPERGGDCGTRRR